jgi:hypothetical protein
MVIVRLLGGLGNQMFQYAAGRAIAHRTSAPLRLDLAFYKRPAQSSSPDTSRTYDLDRLNIQAGIASRDDVQQIERAHRRSVLARIATRFPAIRPLCRDLVVNERHFNFDPGVTRLRGNVYLDGYWQSEKYFQRIAPAIRKELAVKGEPDDANREMARRIRRGFSVSVHVRRGDYVSNSVTHAVHGTCTIDYYRAAIAQIVNVGVQPELFVFSDDPAWAQENLRVDYPTTYVTHNGPDKSHEDLRLMSLCSHHVIANSSFSWWGAWLSDNPGKRVVAPRQWFRTVERNTADLIPPEWLQL